MSKDQGPSATPQRFLLLLATYLCHYIATAVFAQIVTTDSMVHPVMKSLNCVVIGDSTVGKTCLLLKHTTNAFPHEYIPAVFTTYTEERADDNGEPVALTLWDAIHPEEDYILRNRVLSLYPKADVFLVCFSPVNPCSFENVKWKWLDEIERYAPDVPIVLVGTKLDLRDNAATLLDLRRASMKPVSYEHASTFARKILAHKYVECSSLTQQNLSAVFDEAVRAALGPQPQRSKRFFKRKSSKCSIL